MTAAATSSTRGETVRADLVAGLTTALVLVPQAMGYATLAGLPPIAGLHAATFGLVAYALLGSSSALAVGPVAMDSLLVGAALSAVVPVEAPNRLALAGVLALLVGGLQVAMGALRLGHLTNFVSFPVLTGFTTSAALLILANQLPSLLGLPAAPSSDLVPLVVHLVRSVHGVSIATAVVGFGSIALAIYLEKKHPRRPRAPIVLAVATAFVAFVPGFELVVRVGTVARSLPHPALSAPSIAEVRSLAPFALTIAFVAYIEAHSVSKKFAERCGEPNPSREFLALGASNLVSGLTGGFPITGGLGRSAVLVRAGARTRLAGAVTAGVVLVTTLALGPFFSLVPRAALDAVVVTSVVALVDVTALRAIARVAPRDALWAAISFVATLMFGFQWGIATGIAFSLGAFLHESTAPHVAVLGRIPGTTSYRNRMRYPEAECVPGVLVVRIDSQLYFGNATFLREKMAALEAEAAGVSSVVVDASGIGQLDSSAEAALSRLVDGYDRRNVRFAIASVRGPVRDVMKRSGLWKRLGRERLFLDVHSAVQAMTEKHSPSGRTHALSPAI